MFVFLLAVPGLLVVVLGYVVGYALWSSLAGPAGAEAAGWVAGLLLLGISAAAALRVWRARRRR